MRTAPAHEPGDQPVEGVRGVEMARGVDAEILDPSGIDCDQTFTHAGTLGEQVIEPGNVAEAAAFAREGGMVAGVIEQRLIEPARHIDLPLSIKNEGRVGKGRIG